jgi:hypothetical protein
VALASQRLPASARPLKLPPSAADLVNLHRPAVSASHHLRAGSDNRNNNPVSALKIQRSLKCDVKKFPP